MDRQDTEVISGQAPHCERTAQRRDTWVSALEHPVSRQGVLLLASCLLLHVGDTRSDVVVVDSVSAALAELQLILKLLTLVLQPLRDLLTAERQLARAVGELEDGKRVLRVQLATDGERATTRSRNGAASLVTGENDEIPMSMNDVVSLTWT